MIPATVAYVSRVLPIPGEVAQDTTVSVTQLVEMQAVQPTWIEGDKKLVPKLSPDTVSGVKPEVAPFRAESTVRIGAS